MFLFSVLVFQPRGIWCLSSPNGDQTYTFYIGRQSLNHWATREVPSSCDNVYVFISNSSLTGLSCLMSVLLDYTSLETISDHWITIHWELNQCLTLRRIQENSKIMTRSFSRMNTVYTQDDVNRILLPNALIMQDR